MKPHFIIIGAQKAGTTAAIRNLSLHPNISVFRGVTEYGQKEVEFFNQHWERGIGWYESHFPPSQNLVGEKTAELFHRTICHRRMFETNPGFKLILLLRNPVERAYSQWKMAALWKKDETEQFGEVVARGIEALSDSRARNAFYTCSATGRSPWREGYILKGMYAEQLRSLLQWFPSRSIYIAVSERLRRHPEIEYQRLLAFLEVEGRPLDTRDHFLSPPAPPMPDHIVAQLTTVYRGPNDDLFSLLGQEIPEWSSKR